MNIAQSKLRLTNELLEFGSGNSNSKKFSYQHSHNFGGFNGQLSLKFILDEQQYGRSFKLIFYFEADYPDSPPKVMLINNDLNLSFVDNETEEVHLPILSVWSNAYNLRKIVSCIEDNIMFSLKIRALKSLSKNRCMSSLMDLEAPYAKTNLAYMNTWSYIKVINRELLMSNNDLLRKRKCLSRGVTEISLS